MSGDQQACLDPGPIVAALDRHQVNYVVVGGYAAVLHGASRPTRDLDITPATDIENMTRAVAALHELGAGIRVEGEPEGFAFDADPAMLAASTTLNLRTPHGDLDLTMRPDGTDGYDDLARNAQPHAVGPVTVRLASLDDIIRSKQAAGRVKDAEALPELYRLAGREQPRQDATSAEKTGERTLTAQERIARAREQLTAFREQTPSRNSSDGLRGYEPPSHGGMRA